MVKIDHCCNCQVLFPENEGMSITIQINQCSPKCAATTYELIMNAIKSQCRRCGSKEPTLLVLEKPDLKEQCYNDSWQWDDLTGDSGPVNYYNEFGEVEYQEE